MKFHLEKVDDIIRLNYEDKGFVDFRLVDDLLIWDCYTYKKYRGQGIFKILLEELNNRYPDKIFCAAIANKKLIPFLEKNGYIETKEGLPYWGKPSNSKIMRKYH
jgi:GNAT superfamily N-acetyltransferase